MPFTGSTVPPFLRYGVSHSLLSDTRPLAANEKDPSASLGMTIREECVSHTLFLCMMHEISIPYTVISSAVEKSSLHSVLPCPFRGRLPILLCHTYDAIPVCKKDRGLRSGWRCGNGVFQTYPLYATWNKPILPYRHFERCEKSSLHSALSCSFRKSFPLFRYHTYGAIPVCKKDRGLRSGWRYRNRAFSAHPLYDA